MHILAMTLDTADSTAWRRIRDAFERHAALGPDRVFMARIDSDGAIVRIAAH